MQPLTVRIVSGARDPAAVERLLRALPDWFGIAESVVEYVGDAARLPTYLAYAEHAEDRDGSADIGVRTGAPVVGALLVRRHFPESAEVHLMAVDPGVHRRGVGHALLTAVEADLRADGVQLLQVKTQGPSRPDDDYRRTLLFYRAEGFVPLEEIIGLWAENPCLILVKTLA